MVLQLPRIAKKVLGAGHWAGDPDQRLHDTIEDGNIHAEQYWDRAPIFHTRAQ